MKRFLICVFTLLLLAGCGAQEPMEVTLDSSTVIVCAGEGNVMQAALSLQTTLAQKGGLALEIVPETAKGSKTVTVAVDASLAEGQYRTRIVDGNIAIEAQSPLALVIGMRNIRQIWVADDGSVLPLTEKLCADMSGTIDLKNAPFLVMSQNVRYADDEGGNLVVQRAPRFNLLVQEYLPDIICLQEDSKLWSGIVDKMFSENYGHTGFFHGKDMTNGNRHAIFFRAERYELMEDGVLWLSETPDEPGTKLADSKSIRSCTWTLLKDKLTDQELFVCNTHLDTFGEEVRVAQLEILLENLGGYMEQYPSVFCGDFNAQPDGQVYARVTQTLSDPHVTAEKKLSEIEITCDKYGTWETPKRLDYLFYNDKLTANQYRVMTDQYDGYISDHFGITTEYSFVK